MDILVEAPNLLRRYQNGEAFRRYVDDRAPLVLAVAAVFLMFSLATTTGAVVSIGGTHSLLVLLMLVLSPFLLAGTFLTLGFMFFSWLENRSLALTLARVKKPARRGRRGLRERLGDLPPIPWLPVVVFVAAPLALLAVVSVAAAALMLFFAAAAPVAYAWLERRVW
ncbi:MAG TPA: hypothetical protein VF211_06185 [Burkholderiales bacterium]